MSSTSAQKEAKKRISVSLEFDDLLSLFRKQTSQNKQKSQKERQIILDSILKQTVQKIQVKVEGNQYTLPEFVAEELNIQPPSTIEECSAEVYAGLETYTGLKKKTSKISIHFLSFFYYYYYYYDVFEQRLHELDLFEHARAELDTDSENPEQLNINVKLKEKRILSASAGASHSATSFAPVTGVLIIFF
ncbi:hypothetical protein RFI_31686 [Reticulomyxa filosa]|uniref:Uncharacterized protein n=1 Tax=Reticulomyxa filosa TaxID=46433 RepID=X6LUU2_RETFI|nr:hypothetical protein RFI_31686 [Reticulomyxa filosa]|eukprot:ETO05708.1 hypothetical protein RFI_31686 [Reticulomyxa filosa]